MYWAMTNIAAVVAFFITVFYWSFLTGAGKEVILYCSINLKSKIFTPDDKNIAISKT